ncbi:MAG: hypothetical protein M9890_11025 [Thermomicrobiales bacterium]|nr:hypothetical protein [Thermomicrobiales bacterium]
MADPTDIVNVPVPVRFLGPVYGLLSELLYVERFPDSVKGPDDPLSEGIDLSFAFDNLMSPSVPVGQMEKVEWDPEEVELLREILTERELIAPIALMDLTTANAGTEVVFGDIVEATGLSRGKAQNQLAQLTWIVRDDFERQNWPIHVRTNTNGRTFYSAVDYDVIHGWRGVPEE